LARNSERLTVENEAAATASNLELLTSTLLESLRISGYIKPHSGAATDEKIRRLVRRLSLSEEDAETLVGMLRKVTWKMKNSGDDRNR
ncbi:MAG TPA: hypothetical protein VG897_06260, partial [Terriglobales bacterium]|nr:hypothetical protein [Terriglobales bacterium]